MIGLFIFIYGLCFGSFYGVIISRLPNDQSLLGRSHCPNCNVQLKAIDLIPLISYIKSRGKCKYCNEKIDTLCLYIEISTGLLFLLAYLIFGLSLGFLNAICLWSMLLIVGVIDLREKIIIDNILIVFTIISLVIIFIFTGNLRDNILAGLIGLSIYGIFHLVTRAIYKKEVFGLGDVFFIFAVCLNLGTSNMFLTLFLPFYLCLAYTIIILLLKRNKMRINLKSEIPFGPFISISTFFITLGNSLLDLNFNIFL